MAPLLVYTQPNKAKSNVILDFRMHDGVPQSVVWQETTVHWLVSRRSSDPSLYSTFVSSMPNWNKAPTLWSVQRKKMKKEKKRNATEANHLHRRKTCCLCTCPTWQTWFIHNISAGQTFSPTTGCSASTPPGSLLLTIHALPWCNRSPSKLVTISQNFFCRKYCWNNNTALPWELKDNCMSLWHCCFISFMLHFWFPPESCFFSLFLCTYLFLALNLSLYLCIS